MEIKEELLDIDGIKKSKKPLLDLFIRRTAVITSTREDLVEKIVKDQWRQANKVTQIGSAISEIDFCNMGVLFLSSTKAKKRIERIGKKIKVVEDLSPVTDQKIMDRRELSKQRYRDTIDHINFKIFKTKQ